jgi:hypothetical protein
MDTLYYFSSKLHLFKLSHTRLTDLFQFRWISCTICVAQLICFSSHKPDSLLISPSSDGHPVQFLMHNPSVCALNELSHTRLSDLSQTRFSFSNSETFGLPFGPLIQGISQTFVQLSVLCESSTLSTVSVDGTCVPRIAGCMNFKVTRIRNLRQKTPYEMQLRVWICNIVPFPFSFGKLTKRDRISARVPLRLTSVILQKMSTCSSLKWHRIYSMTPGYSALLLSLVFPLT